jgi:tRNA G18 (ribose-2'-O)-methylase SpoU
VREPVDRFDDPRLDDYRNLPDSELLARRHAFVAEGRLVVARLLASPRFRTRSVMVTTSAARALDAELAGHPALPIYEVTQEVMNRVTGIDLHRGCLAIGERPSPEAGSAELGGRLLLALEAIGNADNVGSIFRSAAAFGVDEILLEAACTDPLYRKALRTSMGHALRVPFARVADWPGALATARQAGITLLALTPEADAPSLASLAGRYRGHRLMLVLGHEGDGLRTDTMAACDTRARIPMHEGIDSLNVAVAAAIALYELSRGR